MKTSSPDLLDLKPAKPKRGLTQAQKVVLLWVLLIVAFLVIYQLMTPPPHPARHARPPSPRGWLLDNLPMLTGLGTLLLASLWALWSQRKTARFILESAEPIALLKRGSAARAAELFEALIPRHPRNRNAARYNAASAYVRSGRIDRAIELFTLVANDSKKVPTLQAQTWAELAGACALAGQPDEAAAWLAKVEALPTASSAGLVWARVLIAARRGQLAEVARTLETNWRELESTLTGEVMRRLTLLRAYAVATSEGPRGTATAEPLLVRLRPTTPGELDWLTGSWPELAAFVADHNL